MCRIAWNRFELSFSLKLTMSINSLRVFMLMTLTAICRHLSSHPRIQTHCIVSSIVHHPSRSKHDNIIFRINLWHPSRTPPRQNAQWRRKNERRAPLGSNLAIQGNFSSLFAFSLLMDQRHRHEEVKSNKVWISFLKLNYFILFIDLFCFFIFFCITFTLSFFILFLFDKETF